MDPTQSGDFQQNSPSCCDRIAAPGQQVLSPEVVVVSTGGAGANQSGIPGSGQRGTRVSVWVWAWLGESYQERVNPLSWALLGLCLRCGISFGSLTKGLEHVQR